MTKTELVRLGIDFESVENDSSTTYALNPQLSLVYCNKAWDVFASRNGGKNLLRDSVVGTSILDTVPKMLTDFFAEALSQVQTQREIWEHDYECSSALQYRLFRMRVLPVNERHLLVEHSLRVESAHKLSVFDSAANSYESHDGTVTMCCHCRRVLRKQTLPNTWDFVPGFIEKPPRLVSHGLCSNCRSHYYADR